MPVYKVTVSVRGVVRVQADSDAIAGSIAYDYVDRVTAAGRSAMPVPPGIMDTAFDTFVQAAASDDDQAALNGGST